MRVREKVAQEAGDVADQVEVIAITYIGIATGHRMDQLQAGMTTEDSQAVPLQDSGGSHQVKAGKGTEAMLFADFL